jgi:hypothetical protein
MVLGQTVDSHLFNFGKQPLIHASEILKFFGAVTPVSVVRLHGPHGMVEQRYVDLLGRKTEQICDNRSYRIRLSPVINYPKKIFNP